MCKQNSESQILSEYMFLRDEMQRNGKNMFAITTFTLPILIGILSYALKVGICWIALAALFFAISMLFKQVRHRESTYRISAYCIVFLEPYIGITWETMLYEAQTKGKDIDKEKKQVLLYSEWVFMSLASIVVFIVLLIDWDNISLYSLQLKVTQTVKIPVSTSVFFVFIVIISSIVLTSVARYSTKMLRSAQLKSKWLKEWTEIKMKQENI